MGLFGKLFEKENCAFCGKELGVFGKKKLEDGVMCGKCQEKLSPWFTERKQSTIAEIQQQLDYREANKEKVAAFRTTRTFGTGKKILLDEDNQKFMVTSARNLEEANPDVLDFTQVTGVDLDTTESRSEEKRQTPNGEWVSYNPPRYTYRYDFDIAIMVNHPYFECMKFELNRSSVEVEETGRRGMFSGSSMNHPRIREYEEMGQEVKRILTEDGGEQESAPHPKEQLTVQLNQSLPVGTILRRKAVKGSF